MDVLLVPKYRSKKKKREGKGEREEGRRKG